VKEKVAVIALWDFTGPEGSASGVGRGLVKRGTILNVSRERANELLASQKVRMAIQVPEQKRPGPERRAVDGPTSFKYSDLTAVQVLEKVNVGYMTPVQALELEREQENPRSTLIIKLKKLIGG
jgi:hypothetical protein